MHKSVYFALFISISHAQDSAMLLHWRDGKTYYSNDYFEDNKSYYIEFDADDSGNGHIGEMPTASSAVIKNNVVTLGILPNPEGAKRTHRIANPSELTHLLEIYKIVQKDFEIRKMNNTLPPIQNYK